MSVSAVIFTKSACPNCTTAKKLLEGKGIPFSTVDVEQEPHRIPHGVRQMPQIFINGQRVGGLAGLQAALKQLGV